MTIYRRRLASTIQQRLEKLGKLETSQLEISLEDLNDDLQDEDEAQRLEQEALQKEERYDLESLLQPIRQLPTDTKAQKLRTLTPHP